MPAEIRKLSDCAEVLPGYSLKARADHEPEGTFQVVMAKHIPDGMDYEYIDFHELRITPKGTTDKYEVHNGDVLFISRGTRNQAVVVKNVPEKTIASATLYILKVKEGIDPAYLAWTLNQSPVQSQITQIRTGAGTPIVQRKLIVELEIPVPSLEKQKQIAEVGRLTLREKDLQNELVELTDLKHNLIGQQLLGQLYEVNQGENKNDQ
jgi:restriction endonuclease S subunit